MGASRGQRTSLEVSRSMAMDKSVERMEAGRTVAHTVL
jgi:hypothetical protein